MPRANIICCLNVISEKTPPTEFILFKFGENPAYHFSEGEEIINFADTDAYRFMANNKGKRVMVDYDHGSLMMESPNPAETSKAAGWGSLDMRGDGLYLKDIEWTPLANEKLKAGEFMSMSPAYTKDRTTGEMDRLINVAITNLPALQSNAAILNQRGKNMDEKELNDLKAELAAMKLAAKQSEKEVTALKAKEAEADINKAVDGAMAEGKIGKADVAEYMDYGKQFGISQLNKLFGRLPRTLPSTQRLNAVEPKADVTAPKEQGLLSHANPDRVEALLKTLSAKTCDGAPALIKNDADREAILNKIRNAENTMNKHRFVKMSLVNKGRE